MENDGNSPFVQRMDISDHAVANLEERVRADPGDAAAWSALGMRRMGRSEFNLAIPALEQVLALNPSNAWARSALGYLYQETSRTDLALPLLEKAVSDNPRDPLARLSLGKALAACGKPEEAREQWRAVIGIYEHLTGRAPDPHATTTPFVGEAARLLAEEEKDR